MMSTSYLRWDGDENGDGNENGDGDGDGDEIRMYLLPGMKKIGASSKKSLNFSAFSVADEMMSFSSGRNREISFSKPNRISV